MIMTHMYDHDTLSDNVVYGPTCGARSGAKSICNIDIYDEDR